MPASPGHTQPGSAAAFRLFAPLWAAATLFHIASFNQFATAPFVVAAAVLVLLMPGSALALAALGVTQVVKVWQTSPVILNHWVFASMVDATIVGIVVALAIRRQRLRGLGGEVYDAIAPATRWALIGLYFFATIHKLNTDWFDIAVSCATRFYDVQRGVWPFLPDGTFPYYAGIYGTLVVEAAIPVLLVLHRCRWAGIVLGTLFHLFLAMNPLSGFYNFSSMLIAIYALFIPPAVVEEWMARLGRARFFAASWGFVAVGATLVWLVLSGRAAAWWPGFDPYRIFFAVCSCAILALFIVHAWPRFRAWANWGTAFALPHRALLVLPLVVATNGVAPYLGLKTEAAWGMFSNLRTEGNRSNHFFLPVSLQVFDYQRDLVQVTDSSDSYLRSLARRQRLVPYFELRRRPHASVSYRRRGVTYAFERVADDPRYRELPVLLEKFMLFRAVPWSMKQECVH